MSLFLNIRIILAGPWFRSKLRFQKIVSHERQIFYDKIILRQIFYAKNYFTSIFLRQKLFYVNFFTPKIILRQFCTEKNNKAKITFLNHKLLYANNFFIRQKKYFLRQETHFLRQINFLRQIFFTPTNFIGHGYVEALSPNIIIEQFFCMSEVWLIPFIEATVHFVIAFQVFLITASSLWIRIARIRRTFELYFLTKIIQSLLALLIKIFGHVSKKIFFLVHLTCSM